jgi:RHS repeat-associated protein
VNDADTGLVYMQARYYDARAGRLMSVDPIVTDADTGASFNRYEYANSNPYRFVDPTGMKSEESAEPKAKLEVFTGSLIPRENGGGIAGFSSSVGPAGGGTSDRGELQAIPLLP